MNRTLYLIVYIVVCIVLTSCSSIPITSKSTVIPSPSIPIVLTNTSTRMPSLTPTLTLTRTPTKTPTPTYTSTPTPTLIGVIEPLLAYVGFDSKGQYGIYIDGFYSNTPKKITGLNFPEDQYKGSMMKWSKDGKYLAFDAYNSNNEPAIYLYDTTLDESYEIVQIPRNERTISLMWSSNNQSLFVYTYSNNDSKWIIDIPMKKLTKIRFPYTIHSNNHDITDKTALWCCCEDVLDLYPDPIKRLIRRGGRNDTEIRCYYPDFDAYGGYNFYSGNVKLFTADGEFYQHLFSLYPQERWNGAFEIFLSPDKKFILIAGEENAQGLFAYTFPYKDLPINLKDISLNKKIFDSQRYIHFYGWSPDSLNYVVAVKQDKDGPDILAIRDSITNSTVFEYTFSQSVTPVLWIHQGTSNFDIVWPFLK